MSFFYSTPFPFIHWLTILMILFCFYTSDPSSLFLHLSHLFLHPSLLSLSTLHSSPPPLQPHAGPLTAANDASSPLIRNISPHRRWMMTPALRVVSLWVEWRTRSRTLVVFAVCREGDVVHSGQSVERRALPRSVGKTFNSLAWSSLFPGGAFWAKGIESDPTSATHRCTLMSFGTEEK